MPQATGWDLLKGSRGKTAFESLPVIVITGGLPILTSFRAFEKRLFTDLSTTI
ncbi:MAG: hypothetical protein H0W08_05065 [Acidobacteria bacterium]|nr:hypothetical protein [Acidobacteriota bacterium]